jgi:hypothetical protein
MTTKPLSIASLLAEPEKHTGTINRVEDVLAEKATVKKFKLEPMVGTEAETDFDAAVKSLKRRHPDIHRKMLHLD